VLRVLQALLAVAAVGYLLQSGQLALDPLRALADRWPWWLAAQGCFAGVLCAMTLRWHGLLRIHGLQAPLRETAALVLVGMTFNQVAPGATGGDIVKAVAIAARHSDRRASALLSIAADRVLGLVTLAATVALAACADASRVLDSTPLALFAVGAAGGVLGALCLFALLQSDRMRGLLRIDPLVERLGGGWLGELAATLAGYRHQPALLLQAVGWSMLLHALNIATNLCLGRAVVGPDLPALGLVSIVPMIHLAAGVPITPFGNAGVLETLYAQLLAYAGIAQGAAIGLLMRSLYWTWALVGAAVLLLRRTPEQPSALEPEQPEALSG
jgi:uncharacterized membrane protein YbhN (UPF0104 family)